jgi:quinol monooxygenase YgiN
MHVQIVNFRLKGATEQEYAALCDELAPAYAAIPGLLSKVWLADSTSGTYGGVYVWDNREAMERYISSDLCQTVMAHPNLADITTKDFGVLEAPTRLTRGLVPAHA